MGLGKWNTHPINLWRESESANGEDQDQEERGKGHRAKQTACRVRGRLCCARSLGGKRQLDRETQERKKQWETNAAPK